MAKQSLSSAPVGPGDHVNTPGEELTFEEITEMVGELIVMDQSTESRHWYKVVRVERIAQTAEGRRLIYFDGKKQHGIVSERYFADRSYTARFPARAYRLPVGS